MSEKIRYKIFFCIAKKNLVKINCNTEEKDFFGKLAALKIWACFH